ncbi:polyprenyl synthetase family protein [Candidatus Woesearchaeota archaeon]|jgi:geranylgeranyl diphosphate synthase, type I|nr:polyprenyl synthetase family protein [Candidatus Woesearchaeota archaeon]MBT5272801.1 polyprenyl synthetase family protein [Candidatus Woesearchaeota archaeon]MBT6040413.1 polyprenyl synthetase family protein [Candidatus Woesearchaeota archaeon]MBT6336954.1 polyprenyl synthetase family protein [Candidatus Woesearchaeota archaeon]MBT7926840.1 polyprenyl synthetase family protein [Candidatus Woesearchaeota archaeon]
MLSVTFQKELEEYQAKINLELDNFFNKVISENNYGFNVKLLGVIKEFTMRGGKRIRPLLVLKGFQAVSISKGIVNQKLEQEVLKLSICVELMQTSFLIHDDIMDKSELRRNKPTVHKILGENMAILAGNIAMILAQKIITDSNFSEEIKLKATNKFNEIIQTTNYGQILDLQLSEKNIFEVNEDDINQIHLLKTAKYTIEGPLQLGVILAGDPDNVQDKLVEISKIALPLGRAFQIQDDLLGIFGSEEKLGKSVFSDIIENKKTLLVWCAYMKANEEEKEFIKLVLGKQDISEDEFSKLKEIIIKTGSKDYSKEKLIGLTEQVTHFINSSLLDRKTKNFLLNLAEFFVDREF